MDFGLRGRAKDHANDDDGMNAVNVGHFFKVNYNSEFDSSRRRKWPQGEGEGEQEREKARWEREREGKEE